jgi:hypothetical protein
MQLPFRRSALRERGELDEFDALSAASEESASARVELVLELSDLSRAIGEGARAPWVTAPRNDLAEKAEVYSRALKLVAS